MIIQEIIIENYLCYYDVKKFVLSEGLNIILGENGEGKTKFFEAVDWLFKDDNNNQELLVSAKKLSEIEIGETFRVRVSILVKQYSETKILTRQFTVKKTDNNSCDTSKAILEGVEENINGERTQVDGQRLRDQIFPTSIRIYSMFKGETALNIFDNPDALMSLINTFSEAKHYDKYGEKGIILKSEAEKAVDQATRSATKNQAAYNRLEGEIRVLEDQKGRVKIYLDSTTEQIRKTKENIADVENYVSNAEALEIANKRIFDIREKINNATARIDEEYTTALFDERWLLMNFESFHKEFAVKVNEANAKKRELQSQFDKEQGIKIGEKRARIQLLNNSIPLPLTVPSKAVMEEMIADQICKVCNRPAEKDSDPYNFMLSRLEEYIRSQIPTSEESEEIEILFPNDYITKLTNVASSHEDSLSGIRGIRTSIKDLFEFNDTKRQEIDRLTTTLESEIEGRDRIIGNSTLGESKLQDVLKNYNGWQKDLLKYQKDEIEQSKELIEINEKLKSKKAEKESIDVETAHTFLIKTRSILRDICLIFADTKEAKFDEFVLELQAKANEYFNLINSGAFTGEILISRKPGKQKVDIDLQEEGRTLYKPNQSLLTSMHISILFAISELASNKNEEGYPMIFDAPTSSFGETKTGAFLNIISETGNQIILLSKDFIVHDQESNSLQLKPEFGEIKRDKAFWVKLERPFDRKVLKTINTEVITL